ncbi:hypothetical protein [Actinomadura litoris]|uniref:DUF2637 domain-containing protein n=1 Tax=Actinomadura litoris TaxID=2678616 RepID=A0A7K1LAU9_9ACTN|nr:hypothetical protein [Actinomadura litoris]MUN41443.1 hypothetical protein [Actinomadura litoris]
MSTQKRPGLIWACAVLTIAAANQLLWNLWHAFDTGMPHPLAVATGAVPVLLALGTSALAARVRCGNVQRTLTYGVMLAAIGISILAQYDLLMHWMGSKAVAVLFPTVGDLATLIALHVLIADPVPVRVAAPVRTKEKTRTTTVRTAQPVICERSIGTPYVRAPQGVLRAVRNEQYVPERTGEETRTPEPRTPSGEPRTAEHAARTRAVVSARTTRTDQVSAPVRGVREGRAHWVEVLADEIRTARTEGRTWEPAYVELEARTGWGRSWCEKTVRAAREAAEERTGTRTGTDDA